MKTSIIIATYNGESYIEEQLESIRNQTEDIDQVIIADDCSVDNTREIVTNFINRYHLAEFWSLELNEKNKGYARNFLEAALKADGDIIYFSDQDDIWHKDKIEVMNNIMQKNKEIDILCCSIELFFTGDQTQRIDKKYMDDMSDNGELMKVEFNSDNFHLKRPGCAMCLRRDFLHNVYPYWVENWSHDDYFWKMGLTEGSLYKLQRVLMQRRMHNKNTTIIRDRTRDWRIALFESYELQYKSMLMYAEKLNLSASCITIIEKNIKSLTLRTKLVRDRNLICWLLLLIEYLDCYPRIKGVYLDLYLTLFKKIENARI